jgi:acyl carrier protein
LYQQQPYVAPANATEQALAALWDEVLEVQKVGVTHSFVELGGDSLKAIRLLSRIFQHFGVEVKLQELFPRATVRDLAGLVSERLQLGTAGSTDGESTIAPPTPEELEWLAEDGAERSE